MPFDASIKTKPLLDWVINFLIVPLSVLVTVLPLKFIVFFAKPPSLGIFKNESEATTVLSVALVNSNTIKLIFTGKLFSIETSK